VNARQPGVMGVEGQLLLLEELEAYYHASEGVPAPLHPVPQFAMNIAAELENRYATETILSAIRVICGPSTAIIEMRMDEEGKAVEEVGGKLPSWAVEDADALTDIGQRMFTYSRVDAGALQDHASAYLGAEAAQDEDLAFAYRRTLLDALHNGYSEAASMVRTGKTHRGHLAPKPPYMEPANTAAMCQRMAELEAAYLGAVLRVIRAHPVVAFLRGSGHRIASIPGAVTDYYICMRKGGMAKSAARFKQLKQGVLCDATMLGTAGEALSAVHEAMQSVMLDPDNGERYVDSHLATCQEPHPGVIDEAPFASLQLAEAPLSQTLGSIAAEAADCAWTLLERGRPHLALEIASRYAGRRKPQATHPSHAWATDSIETVRIAACSKLIEAIALNSLVPGSTAEPGGLFRRCTKAPVLELCDGPLRRHAFEVTPYTTTTTSMEPFSSQRAALWGGENWGKFCQLTGYQGNPEEYDPYMAMENLLRAHIKEAATYMYDGLWSDGGGAGTPAAVARLRGDEIRNNTGMGAGMRKCHSRLQNTFAAMSVPIVSAAMNPNDFGILQEPRYYVENPQLKAKAIEILHKVALECVGEALEVVIDRRQGCNLPYYSPRRAGSWMYETTGMEHDYMGATAMHDTPVL